MPINRKSNAPLLLAGLAAFAYYKFNKMSPEQKNELKERGRGLADKYLPQNLRDMFSKITSGSSQTI